MLNLKITTIAVLMIGILPLAHAQDSVNLENLEKSYWSAKDDDFSVVQNRAFSKKQRFSLSGQLGIPVNDPYADGTLWKGELDYFFNEHWGAGISYQGMDYGPNSAVQTFKAEHNVVPDHNILKDYTAANLYYAPLYAKMSLLDKKIIYFDMGIGVHVGNLEYEMQRNLGPLRQTSIGYGFSIWQQFYLSNKWSVRWDYQQIYSRQEKDRYQIITGQSEDTRSLGMKDIQNTTLTIGITYWK